jgi:Spy/CpxP family protein refolding chaperone
MKKLLIPLVAIFALTLSANAQDKMSRHGGRGHHRHHGKGMLAKELNFSEDQKKTAKLINDDFRKKMKELNAQENITVKEMRDRKALLFKDKKAKMDGLLTAEQKVKLEKLKADRKAKMQEGYAKRLEKMKANLNLSDEQVAKLRSQRENMRARAQKIRSNDALSREQKKEQMMALKAEAKEQHSRILTPEQMNKMKEMRKNHAGRERIRK